MKILVTGFDPFGDDIVNPAFEAVKLLPDHIGEAQIIKLEVPTVFGKAAEKTIEAIKQEQVDAVICVGQAGGRTRLSLEKVAINWVDARIPDNEQQQPLQQEIITGASTAYFSTLPLMSMMNRIQKNQLPVEISYTAGTFVCNELMYRVLDYTENHAKSVMAGFIHVPFIPEQVITRPGTASLSLETIAESLRCGIEAMVEGEEVASFSSSSGTIC